MVVFPTPPLPAYTVTMLDGVSEARRSGAPPGCRCPALSLPSSFFLRRMGQITTHIMTGPLLRGRAFGPSDVSTRSLSNVPTVERLKDLSLGHVQLRTSGHV